MALRFLHTSDWHLGVSTEGASRRLDHEAFLAWLRSTIDEREIQVLLVSGDVFDQVQPSAEALRLYYRFLGSLTTTCVRQVVVVGGNHDSAARLDAPRDLLGAIDVHVVGGYRSGGEDRLICPVYSQDKKSVEAVVLAVPFVHEFHLGIRTTHFAPSELRAEFTQRFSALYSSLADRANELYPGVPLLATGHLTAFADGQKEPPTREDYPFEIHSVGTIQGLPSTVFDERLRYVALGHIHRMLPVGSGPAWYCGSPIPLNAKEALTPRRVLLVDLDSATEGALRPEVLEIPITRTIRRLEGSPEEIEGELAAATWEEPRPPLLLIEAQVKSYDLDFSQRVHSILETAFPDADERPHVLRIAQHQLEIEADAEDSDTLEISFDDPPTPMTVFEQLCKHNKLELDDELRSTFEEAQAGVHSARQESAAK
jgi:exonuclease SbcD